MPILVEMRLRAPPTRVQTKKFYVFTCHAFEWPILWTPRRREVVGVYYMMLVPLDTGRFAVVYILVYIVA